MQSGTHLSKLASHVRAKRVFTVFGSGKTLQVVLWLWESTLGNGALFEARWPGSQLQSRPASQVLLGVCKAGAITDSKYYGLWTHSPSSEHQLSCCVDALEAVTQVLSVLLVQRKEMMILLQLLAYKSRTSPQFVFRRIYHVTAGGRNWCADISCNESHIHTFPPGGIIVKARVLGIVSDGSVSDVYSMWVEILVCLRIRPVFCFLR